MSDAYAKSELVICRAGATTLAELTVCKKAAILVPFPFATDDHQAVNASALVNAGAAVMFRERDLTGEQLAAELRALKGDGERRRRWRRPPATSAAPKPRARSRRLHGLMWKKWGEKGRPRKAKPS